MVMLYKSEICNGCKYFKYLLLLLFIILHKMKGVSSYYHMKSKLSNLSRVVDRDGERQFVPQTQFLANQSKCSMFAAMILLCF